MAIKILLTFPDVGDLKGSSTFGAHKDKIEVQAFSYGVSQNSHNGVTQGLRNHNDVAISKAGDEVSAMLAMYCSQGIKIAKTVVEFTQLDRAAGEVIYATYTLTDSVITSFNVSASAAGSDDTWSETFTLSFGAIAAKISGKDYADDTRVDVGAVT